MKANTKEPLDEHLATYIPFDDEEIAHIKQLQQFLAMTDNAYARSNLVGHVVAEAFIINASRTAVALIKHPLNGWWMVPGGHCDGNPDVFASAVREMTEETGITNATALLDGKIYDIAGGAPPTRERHGILEPTHLHFDICYAFEVPDNTKLIISHESDDIAWVPVEQLDKLNFPPMHYRRLKKIDTL